jgi:signal transduction histidine kinase
MTEPQPDRETLIVEHILLAGDNPTQAERLRLLLEGRGYRVELARNGIEGLEKVRASPPQLILSDVIMPGMDGYAFCAAVKSSDATRRIPFILFTDRHAPKDIIEGLLRGADNFIPKSASDQHLLERVGRICQQLAHRRKGQLNVEIVVRAGDREVPISADKQQLFELLFSSLEETGRANEQLTQLNQELEAFSYSVSHDLRAPLRHIDGFVGLLRQRIEASGDDQSRDYMARIARAARHMAQLIDDLLGFSRMGRGEFLRSRVDLQALAGEVLEELREANAGRTVQVQQRPLPQVLGDPAMLRVVLVHLLSNAFKYTRTREQPEVELGTADGEAGELVVFVRDNGVGFDMQFADRLFGVFQRLHRSDEFEGTGIGLATVRRIVHRHGGRTWAQAELDRGATFYFSLPRGSESGPGGD